MHLGYKAPEQIKGRYSIQSDIYAFGIVAYYVVTNGTHPFEDIHFADQIDKAVLANTKFPSISERGAAPWPDMEDLIKFVLTESNEKFWFSRYRPPVQYGPYDGIFMAIGSCCFKWAGI